MTEASGRDAGEIESSFSLPYPLQVMLLVLGIVAVPFVGTQVFHLDGRTPQSIAEDRLREKYQLVQVDGNGQAASDGTSISDFSATSGAVTTDVPFLRGGEPVTCTVRMPTGDPTTVEAECAPSGDSAEP